MVKKKRADEHEEERGIKERTIREGREGPRGVSQEIYSLCAGLWVGCSEHKPCLSCLRQVQSQSQSHSSLPLMASSPRPLPSPQPVSYLSTP